MRNGVDPESIHPNAIVNIVREIEKEREAIRHLVDESGTVENHMDRSEKIELDALTAEKETIRI